MSQVSELMAAGQKFHAKHLPATIKINDQSYEVATTGLRSEQVVSLGGVVAVRRISFWLAQSALTEAGQPALGAGTALECLTPEALAGRYQVETALPDPSGQTIILRCKAPGQ